MNITLELYNIIYTTFFSGDMPPLLAQCAEELATVLTIIGIFIAVILPLSLMYGFIKWIINFVK